jgi:hypothetical protein
MKESYLSQSDASILCAICAISDRSEAGVRRAKTTQASPASSSCSRPTGQILLEVEVSLICQIAHWLDSDVIARLSAHMHAEIMQASKQLR